MRGGWRFASGRAPGADRLMQPRALREMRWHSRPDPSAARPSGPALPGRWPGRIRRQELALSMWSRCSRPITWVMSGLRGSRADCWTSRAARAGWRSALIARSAAMPAAPIGSKVGSVRRANGSAVPPPVSECRRRNQIDDSLRNPQFIDRQCRAGRHRARPAAVSGRTIFGNLRRDSGRRRFVPRR